MHLHDPRNLFGGEHFVILHALVSYVRISCIIGVAPCHVNKPIQALSHSLKHPLAIANYLYFVYNSLIRASGILLKSGKREKAHGNREQKTTLVVVHSQEFLKGVEDGITWYFHGDMPEKPVTEEDVIDFLQGNLLEIALEGWLDEKRLRGYEGFLIGWISGQLPLFGRE